jgi:enamine deaminase RidA (YjgF/YER057c/UK114 family)
MEKLGPLVESAIEVFGDEFPVTATTLVGVAALFEPDYLIEVDVTAVID